jgi:hypothetical protein
VKILHGAKAIGATPHHHRLLPILSTDPADAAADFFKTNLLLKPCAENATVVRAREKTCVLRELFLRDQGR